VDHEGDPVEQVGDPFGQPPGVPLQRLAQPVELAEHVPGVDAQTVERVLVGETRTAQENARTLQCALGTVLGFASNVVVVLVFLVFLLVEQAGFARRIESAFGPVRARPILAVVARINTSITQYLAVTMFVCLLTGILTIAVLLAFGVDYAILRGILTFLANYIPTWAASWPWPCRCCSAWCSSVACGRPWGFWCCWCSSTT
jgi:predicted PurR-regulated permease PerM